MELKTCRTCNTPSPFDPAFQGNVKSSGFHGMQCALCYYRARRKSTEPREKSFYLKIMPILKSLTPEQRTELLNLVQSMQEQNNAN